MLKEFSYKGTPKKVVVLKESELYIEGIDANAAKILSSSKQLVQKWAEIEKFLETTPLQENGVNKFLERTDETDGILKPFMSCYRRYSKSLIETNEEKEEDQPKEE